MPRWITCGPGSAAAPYWHGVFGGIYLFHVREANFAHLIAAQTQAEQAAHTTEEWLTVDVADIDCDSRPDVVVSTDAQWLLLDPFVGGTLIEWDWRARSLNLVDTLSRWREGYHQDLIDAAANGSLIVAGQRTKLESIHLAATRAKEPGLEKKLFVDWYRRASLIDHVFDPAETLDNFYRSQYREWGDFVNQPYQVKIARTAKKATITLEREGGAWIDGMRHPLHVEKKIVVEAGSEAFDVFYTVTNTGEEKIAARFGMETNWGISGGDEAEGSYTLYAGGVLQRLNAIEAVSGCQGCGRGGGARGARPHPIERGGRLVAVPAGNDLAVRSRFRAQLSGHDAHGALAAGVGTGRGVEVQDSF